jgi:hypothetical protein
MEYAIGTLFGIATGVLTSLIGMDRDRSLYPAMMIVIALLYCLFAVMGGSTAALMIESAIGTVFIASAVVGFKSTLWFTVSGIVGHGLFDLVHPQVFHNPGVPTWWPGFCGSIDIVLGLYLAWLILRGRVRPVNE